MDHVCNDEQSKKLEKMLEVFAIYGQYLNDIPPNYHFMIAQELSHEIFTYSLELTTFCNHEFKRPKENKTLAPTSIISRDIKTLEKARLLILDKIIHKYLFLHDCKMPIGYNREDFNKLYFETISIHQDSERIDILEDIEKNKKAFDTYFNLTDMIKDLESKSFEIFDELNYFIPKANKNKIREILMTVRKQFKLKASHEEKQLLDNL